MASSHIQALDADFVVLHPLLDLGRLKTPDLPHKKHVLCSLETLEKYNHNRSDIRRMLESLMPQAKVYPFKAG